MAGMEYDVVYVARSPASTPQDEYATQVMEVLSERVAAGWRLAHPVGDYGAKVTLGVWLYFVKESEEF